MQKNRSYLMLLLVILCMLIALVSPRGYSMQDTILPMLIGAASGALAFFFSRTKKTKTYWTILILFAIATFYYPELAVYWPVLIFVVPSAPASLLAAVTLALAVPKISLQVVAISSFVCLLSWHLQQLIASCEISLEKTARIADNAREMEIKLRSQHQELIDKQDADLQIATLNERQRIAREMHDHAGHLLSRALLQLGALMAATGHNSELIPLKETLDQAMTSLRDSVHNLYDTSIDLTIQLTELSKKFVFCPLNLNINYIQDPDTNVKLALIAIFKESLSNIMRHSNASRVEVTFIEHPVFYQFIIFDNGNSSNGKDFSLDAMAQGGMGLGNIARRIEALAGHLVIKSTNGFTLFMTIPKEMP